jgi:formiminotetrahydrofolate cyclodeaminase
MVVAYSLGKKGLAEFQGSLERADVLLRRTADLMLELAAEDAAAYGLVNELQKLPDDHPRRRAEYPGAVEAAVAAPRSVLAAACDLLRLLETLAPITNRHLRSDLAVAAILAEATARAAGWNVEINLPLLPEEARRVALGNESRALVADARARAEAVERAC